MNRKDLTVKTVLLALWAYFTGVFSALSQLANAVVLAGDPNESICGRCYRQSWIVPMKLLDLLLSPFSKGHHCRGAFNQDRSWAIKAAKWPDRIPESEKHL